MHIKLFKGVNDMRRTTVTLPVSLLENLVSVTKAKSKSKAVIVAIEEELKRKKWQRIKESAGKLEFAKVDKIRHDDHRTA